MAKGKAGAFWGGLFTGLILSGLIFILSVGMLLRNPEKVVNKLADYGLVKVVEKTMVQTVTRTIESLPQDYVNVKQDEINQGVQKLTQAYSTNKLSPSDMQLLGAKFFGAMADQKLEPKEIDALLKMVDKLSGQ